MNKYVSHSITIICPVFEDDEIVFWTAARAHHGDIGGLHGNSMPPETTELVQEGARIYSLLLVRDGRFDEEGIKAIFDEAGKFPDCLAARRFQDNLSDLKCGYTRDMDARYTLSLFTEHKCQHVRSEPRRSRNFSKNTNDKSSNITCVAFWRTPK